MKLDKEIYDQIDAYMRESMNEEEKLLFEEKMRSDDLLKQEVDLNKSLKTVVKDEGWVTTDPNNIQKEEISSIRSYRRSDEFIAAKHAIQESAEYYFDKTSPKPKVTKKKWRYYLSTAAAVLLVLLAMKFTGNQDPQRIYETYNDWDQLPSLIVQGDNDQQIAKAELLFEDKKYKEAIVVFNEFIAQSKQEGNTKTNPYISSYLGIAHMELNNYQKALEYFGTLEQSGMIDYSRAYWYKALLFIKKSDMQKAKEQLSRILSDEKNYNYQVAKELLEKLE